MLYVVYGYLNAFDAHDMFIQILFETDVYKISSNKNNFDHWYIKLMRGIKKLIKDRTCEYKISIFWNLEHTFLNLILHANEQ